MSMYFWILHLAKACCRILQLLMNSHSFLARQFTRCIVTFPGYIASIMAQYTAPVPSCSILMISSARVELTQLIRSVLGTKNAPYIIPMLCSSPFIILLYQMQATTLLLLLMALGSCNNETNSDQKLRYRVEDNVRIQQNSSLELELRLDTGADEYLGEAHVLVTLNITQKSSLPFNILFFDYRTLDGQQCYQNWIVNSTVANDIPCPQINNTQLNNLPYCANYSSCSEDLITLQIKLQEQQFEQSYLILENRNADMPVILNTVMQVELLSKNTWFYWGVGLTCLLLISLVIFAGVAFYWSLKYKKVKKMFEQFKLTEQNDKLQ